MKWGAFVVALCALPATLNAQTLREQCANVSQANYRTFCEYVADAAIVLQPRVGIALAGGNPVPGTASTLGMRIGKLPRISFGPRVTAAEIDLPPAERVSSTNDVEFAVGSISLDASIGLFQGFNVASTVGGLGSVDLIASAGIIPLPRGEGFDDSSPFTWALGARVGILREAFTAPGVSLSALYRALGDVAYGSESLSDRDAFVSVSELSMWSLRLTAGKRLLGLGITAGAGYDRYYADVSGIVPDPAILTPTRRRTLSEDDVTTSRYALFGNVSYTFLIASIVAELGWQERGDVVDNDITKRNNNALFGGVALRIGF
jgi:hypothetical protein